MNSNLEVVAKRGMECTQTTVQDFIAVPEEVRLFEDFLHEVDRHLSSEMSRQLIEELSLFPVCVPHPHLSIVVPACSNPASLKALHMLHHQL